LSFGYIPKSQESRNRLLAERGFGVAAAATVENAIAQSAEERFDALIIGPAVGEAERKLVARAFRNVNPRGRIVMLYDESIHGTELADAVVSAHDHARVAEALDDITLEGPAEADFA